MSADQFATKSPELSKQFAENNNEAARINPRIAELFKGEAPQNLEELAGRFDKLFAEVDQQWGDLKKQDPKAIALADPAAEELRQFLYDEATPLNIAADETEKFLLRGPRNEVRRLRKLVIDWTGSKSAPRQAMTLVDASAIAPMTNIFIRGNTSRPGAPVPRQFLSVVAGEKRQPFQRGSGRLELARAITRQDNPLTARVMVNRVWKLHFGEGLVRTPSDFGLRSDPPSHPELLDYLASQFMRQGWSMKQLHRWIVLSATYRQNSVFRSEAYAKDPENRLLWHMNRQRLDLEAMRDAILFAAGELDETLGGPSVEIVTAPFSKRRSIYGLIDRQNLPGFFRTFDFATPDTHSPQRYTTTVPQQALYLMNSPFMLEMAAALAARSEVASAASSPEKVQQLYALAYGRHATAEELDLSVKFIESMAEQGGNPETSAKNQQRGLQQLAQALLMSNEFMFVD